jgi:hypothetical protein
MHPFHKAFSIGLSPLELAEWIEIDDKLDAYLQEKDRLHASFAQKVFVQEPDTGDAQSEVLDTLAAHLLHYFPRLYARERSGIIIGGSRHVDLASNDPPLLQAARLVQEDLVIMRHSPEGWRLVAASLSFPSSWSLLEKFGKPLAQIHAPVPGFGPDSRNAGLINRIFDNLKVEQPVKRLNWSVYANDELYQPDRSAEHGSDNPGGFADHFVRIERQTLRKMPVSGDILFTIRIHLDPLSALKSNPEAIGPFIEQLRALDTAELEYKGMAEKRAGLIKALVEIGST